LGVFYIGQQHTTAHSPRRDSVFSLSSLAAAALGSRQPKSNDTRGCRSSKRPSSCRSMTKSPLVN
jgi:hypothetical protein